MQDADELCDRVAFITQGRISVTDAPENLRLAYGKRILRVSVGSDIPRQIEYPLEGLSDNESFLSMLRSEHIRSMHTIEASLEDVFIKTTGENLV